MLSNCQMNNNNIRRSAGERRRAAIVLVHARGQHPARLFDSGASALSLMYAARCVWTKYEQGVFVYPEGRPCERFGSDDEQPLLDDTYVFEPHASSPGWLHDCWMNA